jgi:Uncharacterized Zn-finger containing protein
MTGKCCSNCGEPLKKYAVVCSNCGKPAAYPNKPEEKVSIEQVEQVYEASYETPKYETSINTTVQSKEPFLALVFSFVFVGLGQVYNGKFWRGIFFMLSTFIGFVLLIVPGLVAWVWAMYDAHKEAEAINNGDKPYKEATVWEIIMFLLSPIIIISLMGFVIFVIRFLIIPVW